MCEMCKMFPISETSNVVTDLTMAASMKMVATIVSESTQMSDVIIEALIKSSEAGMNRVIAEIDRDMEANEEEKAAMIVPLRASHSTLTKFAAFAADLKKDIQDMNKPETAQAVKNLVMLLERRHLTA